MRESNSEGVANHTVPESCVGFPRGGGEALTGAVRAGLSSSENGFRGADAVDVSGTQHGAARQRECRLDPAESKNPGTYRTSLYGNREILWWPARWAQAEIRKPRRRS
jgi:hypothetical protein